MATIYVDSRKRVAGTDADFEFDVGETVHLQNSARWASSRSGWPTRFCPPTAAPTSTGGTPPSTL